MRVRSGSEDEQKYHRSAVQREKFFSLFARLVVSCELERRGGVEKENSRTALSIFLFSHSPSILALRERGRKSGGGGEREREKKERKVQNTHIRTEREKCAFDRSNKKLSVARKSKEFVAKLPAAFALNVLCSRFFSAKEWTLDQFWKWEERRGPQEKEKTQRRGRRRRVESGGE